MTSLVDGHLLLLAKTVDETENLRKALDNRIRHMTRTDVDSDGVIRGLGWRKSDPRVIAMSHARDSVVEVERSAVRALEKAVRSGPFGFWVAARVGIAEKGLARLLGVIGDPYLRPTLVMRDGTVVPSRPRLVSELWSYCGYRPGTRRRTGARSNWSAEAKMRAFVIADSTVKLTGEPHRTGRAAGMPRQRSPYRDLYDKRKAATDGRLHIEPCPPCGPKGAPAEIDSPWSDKHRHVDAIRIVAKQILKDLWIEARRLHEQEVLR